MRSAQEIRRKNRKNEQANKPNPRRVAGIALWAVGIAAGIFGGDYGLLVALALVAAGFVLFMSNPSDKK